MKRLVVMAACFFAFSLVAGSAADSGNLVAALDEADDARRVSALLHALEGTEEASPELLRALNEELKYSGCDNATKQRLLDIWRKRPADFRTARLVVVWVPERAKEQLKLFEATLLQGDFTGTAVGWRENAFELLEVYIDILERMYDLGRAAELLDELVKKYPRDPQIAAMAAELFALGCFRDSDTAPGLRNWDELPGKNVWKKRLNDLHKQTGNMAVKSGADAIALSKLAFILRDRKLLKDAVQIRRRIPVSDNDGDSVVSYSVSMKMPELVGLQDDNNSVYVLALLGDITGAENALTGMSGSARRDGRLFLLGRKNDFQAVRKMIMSEKSVPGSRMAFFTACEAAVSLRDTELLDVLLAFTERDDLYPEIANLLAYSCAELNHRLDKAEKLVRRALELDRRNSSYLDTSAWIFFRKGENAKAREFIGKALKNREPDPSMAVLFLHAAEIELAVTGDKAAARQYFQRAERLYTPEVTDYRQENVQRVKELLK